MMHRCSRTNSLIPHPFFLLSRAVQLRPRDARMWNALGLCFQACGEPSTALAVRCHVRALPHDREGVALHELVRGVCVCQGDEGR